MEQTTLKYFGRIDELKDIFIIIFSCIIGILLIYLLVNDILWIIISMTFGIIVLILLIAKYIFENGINK